MEFLTAHVVFGAVRRKFHIQVHCAGGDEDVVIALVFVEECMFGKAEPVLSNCCVQWCLPYHLFCTQDVVLVFEA